MSTSSDPAVAKIQARIISHMNAQHASSLTLFLRHFNSAPPTLSTSPVLDAITLSSLTITACSHRYIIPLDPPMQEWSEARGRMKELHEESLNGLGLAGVSVERFVGPGAGVAAFDVFMVLLFIGFARAEFLEPGGWLARLLGLEAEWMPTWVGEFLRGARAPVWYFVVFAHLAETAWFARGSLRRYGFETPGKVWWLWVGSCLLDGGFTMRRFNQVTGVLEKEKEEAERKHAEKK